MELVTDVMWPLPLLLFSSLLVWLTLSFSSFLTSLNLVIESGKSYGFTGRFLLGNGLFLTECIYDVSERYRCDTSKNFLILDSME